MRPIVVYSLLSIVIGGLMFASCNKSQAPNTPASILTGKWALIQTATDDDSNQVLDTNELRDVATPNTHILDFHSDGTGVEEVTYDTTTTDFYFTWQLPNGSDYLVRNMEGHNTIIEKIITFSPIRLTLLDSTSPAFSWYIYKKL